MRIYSVKRMLTLDRKMCDIDTQRGIYLTASGGVVRALDRVKRLMEMFGFTGDERKYLMKSMEAMERKKRPLVVSDPGEQFKDWYGENAVNSR